MNAPSLSVFTPSNNIAMVKDAYASLLAQTDNDWEWVILLNGAALETRKKEEFQPNDPRVRILTSMEESNGFVGALKREACSYCHGDILLELDHDDLLSPKAVEEVKEAFQRAPEKEFLYSNPIYATGNLKPVKRFGNGFGWEWRQHTCQGQHLDEIISFPATAVSASRIWFAPDHLRAFTKQLYEKVGGHARDMRVLDDQDLMSRMFVHTDFNHINKPLYIYRIFGNNTWQVHNKEIQDNVMRVYDKYVESMMVAEARRKKLLCHELGGGMNPSPGYTTMDLKNADYKCDLNNGIPQETSTVGVLKAIDVLEHIRNPVEIMKEAYRVLAPGGYFIIQVPSTDGRGAFQDPTHVSFWNENSFLYYTNKNWAKYIDTPVRFQATRLYTTEKDSRGVCWVKAHLVSLKDGYRPPGEIHI